MLKKLLSLMLTTTVVAALASCGTTKPAENDISDSYASQNVDSVLAQSTKQASDALQTLARVQVSRTTPAPSPLDETSLPEELKRPATIDWDGPAEEAARKVAALIGYDFQITGNRPSTPVLIHFSVRDVPAAKALEQIGYQAFPHGEVSVDPNVKRVEFRYMQAQHQPVNPKGASPAWGK